MSVIQEMLEKFAAVHEISGKYVGSALRARSGDLSKILKKWKESQIAKGSSTPDRVAATKGMETQYKNLQNKTSRQVSDISDSSMATA